MTDDTEERGPAALRDEVLGLIDAVYDQLAMVRVTANGNATILNKLAGQLGDHERRLTDLECQPRSPAP